MTAQEIWKELENSKNYKTQHKIYLNASTNEYMIKGEQWNGINLKNLAPTVYNFLSQVAKTQISSVMAQQISITRSADSTSQNNKNVQLASKIFSQLDKDNWERVKMDKLNEDVLEDAFTTGVGGTFWWWNENIITGNDFITKGDFKADYIDAVNLHVSNPNEIDVQKQDWVMISIRNTLKQVKKIFKDKGVSDEQIELIQADESTIYEAYEKAQSEQSNNQATYVLKLYKENDKVMAVYSTANVMTLPINLELNIYPIALMNWEKRKALIYGLSPVTQVIANQKVANMQSSIRHLSAQLMAIPKMGVNKNMITGATNIVGGIYEVDASPGQDISNALHYWQPSVMSYDADKSIDQSIERTKALMGANQALLGESNPQNFRAILAQQKQAGIPLESVKRRFYQYIEDVALVWLDFYKSKYKLTRSSLVDNEQVQFIGVDYKNIYLNTKVDVGASTQLNELVQIEIARELWNMKILTDPVMYVDMLPDFNGKQKLIEKLKEDKEGVEGGLDGLGGDINSIVSKMSKDMQQQFLNLAPEQQQAYIAEFSGKGI
jgi:hypothetical protein